MTPSSSLSCHFQTDKARELGLVSFWSILLVLCIFEKKKKTIPGLTKIEFPTKIVGKKRFLPKLFNWMNEKRIEMTNQCICHFWYVIYIKRASIWDQSQLSNSNRLEIIVCWRWRGQKWKFLMRWFFDDTCLKLNLFWSPRCNLVVIGP